MMITIMIEKLILFFITKLPPELSHKITILVLKYGFNKSGRKTIDSNLRTKLFGISLSNPLGLAAGFDKNAEALKGLIKLNFSFIEVGTVTPKPQLGNKKPRVFRLKKNKSLINSLGFPNVGANKVFQNMKRFRKNHPIGSEPLIGINIGCNKDSEKPIDDYLYCIDKFYLISDYLTINISSPNTPGLRSFHKKEKLEKLMKKIKQKTFNLEKKYNRKLPLVLKMSPDLTLIDIKNLIKLIIKYKFDAIIASNTSVEKNLLPNIKYSEKPGGISGKALFEYSNKTLKELKVLKNKNISIIASGGVSNWKELEKKILLGASAVQIYTGLVYEGPSLINKSLNLLSKNLLKRNISNISQIISGSN